MVTNELIKQAREYFAAGLSVLPVRADKRPAVKTWDKDKGTTLEEFTQAAEGPSAAEIAGLAVICGPVSGGLECIDIDTKADTTQQIWVEYEQALREAVPELLDRLVIATTPTGGRHIYYRWDYGTTRPGAERQGGLAFIPGANAGQRGAALIETRIHGGYAAVPPGDGREFIQGSLLNVPQITPEERAKLWNIARSLTRYTEPERSETTPTATGQHSGNRPSDYFNAIYTIEDILREVGWQIGAERAGRTYVRRPGATTEQSGNIWNNILLVHSTSSGLPVGKPMPGAFSVYAWMYFGGEFTTAARSPRAAACRTPTPPRRVPTPHTRVIATTAKGEPQQVSAETFVVTDIPGEGVRRVLIQYTHETPRDEIRAILRELDNARRPGVFLVEANENAEAGEEVHAATWWLDDIIGPYTTRDITDHDRLEIVAQLVERAGMIHEPVVRDLFVTDAKRLDWWAKLGISKDTIAQEMAAAQHKAQQRAYMEDVQLKQAELADSIEAGDPQRVLKVVKELNDSVAIGLDRKAVTLVRPIDVIRGIVKAPEGYKTGFHELDKRNVRLYPGTLNIVGAYTGNGKTAFIMNMAAQMAQMDPDKVFYYAPYEETKEALFMRFLRIISGKDWGSADIKHALMGSDLGKDATFKAALEATSALLDPMTGGLSVMDPANVSTLEQVEKFLLDEQARGIDVGGVFLDHAQIVKVSAKFEARDVRHRVSYITEACREMAIKMNIPVVLASQTNRASTGSEDKQTKQADGTKAAKRKNPELHHLAESATLERDAAMVLMLRAVHYDDPNVVDKPERSDLEVTISKARECPKGVVGLHFFGATRQVLSLNSLNPVNRTKEFSKFVERMNNARKGEQSKP
jgi:replicative DNA helicase